MRLAVVLTLVAVSVALQPGSPPAGGRAINSACASKSVAGPKVGTVTVAHSDVFFNGGPNRLAHSGNPLASGGAICTADEGDAVLNLAWGGKAKCELGPLAAVKLTTAKKKRFIRVKLMGEYDFDFWCFSGQLDVEHRRIRLRARLDPLFWVSRRGKSVTVRIARGFLRVSRQAPAGSSAPVIVGPNEQTVARGDSAPSSAQRVVPGSLASLFRFGATVSQPPFLFSRPTERRAARSPALKRIRRRDRIVVGFDGGDIDRSPAGRFVKRYFRFLADKWGVSTAFPPVRGEAKARSLLKRNQIDVFVGGKAPDRTLTAPFFTDRTGKKWLLVVNLDPVLLDSLTTFLQSALDKGSYGALYDRSLGQLPVYRTVAPLIFPPTVCAPQPKADLTSELDLALTMKSSPSGPLRRGARVVQTATVHNIGKRAVDCVTLHLHIFGGEPLNRGDLERRGCTKVGQTDAKRQTGELELSCELGRFGVGRSKSLRVVVRPSSGEPIHTETCADVDADESGGLPETRRGDNGDCTALVYRKTSLVVGAAEDQVKSPDAATARRRLGLLDSAGLDAAVITENWFPHKTAPGPRETAELRNAVEAARDTGTTLYLAVYNVDPKDTPLTAADRAEFAAYAAALARVDPSLRHVIVGNEPNSVRFWPKQYVKGRDQAAVDYVKLLAAVYDALKAVDPGIVVIGGALAPRSLEKAQTAGPDSHAPTEFIGDLGAAYKRLGRNRPIMDAFALHPIPSDPTTAPRTAHASTSNELGIADYPLLVSLLGRAFDGTKQVGSTLPVYYTEYAIQSIIPSRKRSLYEGQEQRRKDRGGGPALAVDVSRQALYYRQAIALASCQQTVDGIFFFHVFDQKNLERWQSGLFYANESPKTTARAVRKAALAARTSTTSGCPPSAGVP